MKIGQLNPIFDATDRQLGGWSSYILRVFQCE